MLVLGQTAGPLLGGTLFDLGGSYDLALVVFAGCAVLAAGVALIARPPHTSGSGS